MKPHILQLGLACLVCSCFGCAMCCGPYDYDYPTIGGKHQRTDRTYGRVGSIFSDPMANPIGGSSDSNLTAPERRKRDDSSEEDSQETDEMRDRIKRELKDKGPDEIDDEPLKIEEKRPDPDTKEALRRIRSPLGQWR